MVLPFISCGAVPRHRELKMFDLVNLLTNGGPERRRGRLDHPQARGVREVAHRLTGAGIILFVAVFGLANIYVKALNAVKNR
jgi:multiple sugar transport system permease protein